MKPAFCNNLPALSELGEALIYFYFVIPAHPRRLLAGRRLEPEKIKRLDRRLCGDDDLLRVALAGAFEMNEAKPARRQRWLVVNQPQFGRMAQRVFKNHIEPRCQPA